MQRTFEQERQETYIVRSTEDSDEPDVRSVCSESSMGALFDSPHYENTPIQVYRKIFTSKKTEKLSDKNFDIFFSYFCSKHSLWVFVITASTRAVSNEYSQTMFLSRNLKKKE